MIIFEQSQWSSECRAASRAVCSSSKIPRFANCLLPDNLASAEHARQPKMCSVSGQGIEFLGSAISSALELCARVLVRFTLHFSNWTKRR
jgi:hypothetical protein